MSAGKKVLFVDDDRDFLKSQSILFASKGFQVITAESGEEALKVLENEVPDIIFLDLMMEHYDSGFTLSYQIRKDDRFKNVPLVMLSGVASQTGRRFAAAEVGRVEVSGDSLRNVRYEILAGGIIALHHALA